jgi:cytochrome c nitrite reductase small subunit
MLSKSNFIILIGVMAGLVIGLGCYTFIYAKGYSYLTDDPSACANCHVMSQQYNGWIKSSHRSVAKCNDCHTPASFVGKYATKASNGFWHSFYFTTGWFPDNIQINERNTKVAEQACQKCHQDIVDAIDGPHQQANKTPCITCHKSVGHME